MMVGRGVLLASVSGLWMLVVPPASAADPQAPARPAGSWSGVYVGGFVGAASVDSSWGPATNALSPSPEGADPGEGTAPGPVIGGQLGYNHQLGPVVLGVEGDVALGSLVSPARCLVGWQSICEADTDLLATLAGRIGYARDTLLFYGKLGGALTHGSQTVSGAAGFPGRYEGSGLRGGWTAGGGVELALTPQLSAKAEYAWLDFGSDHATLRNGAETSSVKLSQSAQLVKLGFNWRPFGAPLPGAGPAPRIPGRDWSGFYAGLHAGGGWSRDQWMSGTGFLGAAAEGGSFPGSGTAMGLLGGLQAGYNFQRGPWVAGIDLSASLADIGGYAKCIEGIADWSVQSYACHNGVDALGSIAGRVGQSWGDLLLYGKLGAAWAHGPGSVVLTTDTQPYNEDATRWGWMLGAGLEYAVSPALSAVLEYDYYDFGTRTLTYSGAGERASARFQQQMDVVRMGLNYHFGARGPEAEAPAAAPQMLAGWSAEVGARAFLSNGRQQKDLFDPYFPDRINSRLIYDGTTGSALETFFRLESRDGLFVKGLAGLGTLSGGDLNDEDFPADITYSNTLSALSDGQLAYGALDAGYNVLRGGGNSLGPFVGYRMLHQQANGFGCRQIAADSICDAEMNAGMPALETALGLSETETWQGVALGINSRVALSPRLRLEVDAAYLPFVTRSSTDNHWFRADINPQVEHGTGWGSQIEAILSYAVTDRFDVGLGGRYWFFATDHASTQFPSELPRSPMVFYAERYGGFLQAAYHFGDRPAALPVDTGEKPAPVNWSGLYVGGTLGGGAGGTRYDGPFPPPVTGDAADLGGALAGGQIGVTYQLGPVVAGLELAGSWANIVGTNTCYSTAEEGYAAGFDCGSRVNALATLTGRLGYAFDRALLYGSGGLAWDQQTDSFNNFNYVGRILDNDSTNTGWTVGGGVEVLLQKNLSVALDYRHVDLGRSETFTTPGTPSLAGVNLAPESTRLDLVALRLNYRLPVFGGR